MSQPAPPSPALRRMRWWDIDAVLGLEESLFPEDAWSAGAFWSELAHPDIRHYVVAEDPDGGLVGYAGLATVAPEADVQTIGVRGDRQGRGLGAALLTHLVRESARRGCTRLTLEVRADNDRAQRLYTRFGFTAVGLRRGYYQPSGVDAVVMHRPVGPDEPSPEPPATAD